MSSVLRDKIQKSNLGAGETVLAVLAENLASVPSTDMVP